MNSDDSSASQSRSSVASTQRRAVPRYMLIASMDLADAGNSMQLTGRVTEISRKGCYVDIMNGLPVGTVVVVRIARDQGSFLSQAKVIYLQENLGMGLAFLNTAEDQLRILDSWLAELSSPT